MGIPVSLLLIGAGAILTWAVTDEPKGLDLDAVGVILMVVGVVGLFLTLLFWETWWGRRPYARSTYVGSAPRRGWYSYGYRPRRRATYVEEDAGPPPGPPGPPPP
jgi:hypothetical protein